ncbi:MAG: hypothetical protein AAGA77_13920 [Bacteroidota bacterium]
MKVLSVAVFIFHWKYKNRLYELACSHATKYIEHKKRFALAVELRQYHLENNQIVYSNYKKQQPPSFITVIKEVGGFKILDNVY